MPSATAASIAAAISALLPSSPKSGRRDGERLVVADVGVRARRRKACCRRPACRGRRPRCPRRASRGTTRSGRTASTRTSTSATAARTCAARSPSGSCTAVCPFGNPGGYWKPVGLKYGWRRVEAVVDDPDLHPVPGGLEVRAPELVGADLLRAELGRRARGSGRSARPRRRPAPARASRPRSAAARPRARSRRAGSASGSATPGASVRSRADDRCLLRLDAAQVARVARGEQRAAEDCERRRLQRHDDLGRRHGRRPNPSPGETDGGECRRTEEDERDVVRVRMRGLEPPRPYGHTDLNRARLPIPPHPRGAQCSGVARYDRCREHGPLRELLERAFPDATELDVLDRTGGGDHFQVVVDRTVARRPLARRAAPARLRGARRRRSPTGPSTSCASRRREHRP